MASARRSSSVTGVDEFSERLKQVTLRTEADDKNSHGDLGEQVSPHSMSAKVDRAHIELIQQVQHELRTPVHGLLGTLETLRAELQDIPMDKAQRSSVRSKMDSLGGLADRLQNVLDDFRDFAAQASETVNAREAEEAHEVMPETPIDLGVLLDEVAAEAWNAQVRQIRAENGDDARLPPPPELILQTDTSLRGWKTVVDQDILRKLVLSLVNNALRFTKSGYVEISLAPSVATPASEASIPDIQAAPKMGKDEGSDDNLSLDARPKASENFVELVVEDTGEGMTEDFLSHRLFEPFVKADKFKAGAGLSMTLCSSLVRRIGGAMHVSSDHGRGTVVTVKIPVKSLPDKIVDPVPPSQSDQFIYLYGFEGYGLQRLAQCITAQMATFGNLYATTHIEDADYLLLPEETCMDVEGGIDAILQQTKPGVKIGVLQAHEDAGIEYAAFKNGSRQPTFVTRKPFGPRCFAKLLRLAEQEGSEDTRDKSEYVRDKDGHLGYAAKAVSASSTPVLPPASPEPLALPSPWAKNISVGPLDESSRALRDQLSSCDGSSAASALQVEKADGADSNAVRREAVTSTDGDGEVPPAAGAAAAKGPPKRPKMPHRSRDEKMADLVVSPSTLDTVLRAPQPAPRMERKAEAQTRRPSLTVSSDTVSLPPRKFSVLCVDDNPLNVKIITNLLRQSGIEHYEASDGIEAVEQFKRHLPTVTLMDVNMPRMSGIEATMCIRTWVDAELTEREKRERMLRIVAVTALSDGWHRQRGIEAGMDDWFSKPLKMKHLKSILAEWRSEFDSIVASDTNDTVTASVDVDVDVDAGAVGRGS